MTDKELKFEPGVYMPDYIQERCGLAHIYAEDGAYKSAARVLLDLAKEVNAHAERSQYRSDAPGS